jgi:hypothetical protein
MTGRAGLRAVALALLAAAMSVSPGSARMYDPPAAQSEVVGPRTGLICVWAIYAAMAEVGRKCGVARNAPFEAELARSVSRMEDYARRQSPEGAAAMADYRARQIDGGAEICVPDGLTMYRQMAQASPDAVRDAADRLLASSPPVEWGTCL